MGQRVFAHGHQLPNLQRSVSQAEPVLDVALVLAELLGEAPDAVAVVADHPVVHRRLVQRRQVLALEVLDDRDLHRGLVIDVLDHRWDGGEAGGLRRSPAALAGDELEPEGSDRSDENRLQDAVLLDGGGELGQRGLVE